MSKSADAFRTISEVAEWLDTPAHVLRFWESKFTQVKPVKRAGGRRYYRPADMRLLGGIKKLLHDDGMTIKGVQKILREQGIKHVSSLCELSLSEEEEADLAYLDEAVEAEPVDTVVPFAKPEPTMAEPVVEEEISEETVEALSVGDDEPVAMAEAEVSEPLVPVTEEPEIAVAQFVEEAAPLEPEPEPEVAREPEVTPAPPPEPQTALPGFLQRSLADRVAAEETGAPKDVVEEIAAPAVAAPAEPIPSALTHLARISRLSADQAAQIAPILEQLKARVR
ncbi:MAG: MerR family transcriptional regulator [Marivita sp.]|uniref:MerR family transcriptional regulator n=1 Tax=Marivita sp. TaxID=2003365 RepID=UPI001B052715|nr:MerR family transcriptional regulator [Marivita sp.]MBO6884121.1 MerR family transcriptional regulator [Marivita sp.]